MPDDALQLVADQWWARTIDLLSRQKLLQGLADNDMMTLSGVCKPAPWKGTTGQTAAPYATPPCSVRVSEPLDIHVSYYRDTVHPVRPSVPQDGPQAPRQKQRIQLPDLVRDVGQLENDDLIDLIRVAIGEARRRGIDPASTESNTSRTMPPVTEQKSPVAARIFRTTASLPDMPPAKASMIRAALRGAMSETG